MTDHQGTASHQGVTGYLAAANAAVAAGLAQAAELGIRVSVVVLDHRSALISAQRMPGAYPSAFDVALAKARTAANFGAPTAALAQRITPTNQSAMQGVLPQLMFVAGGLPVHVDGELVGAVGVSGASGGQDHQCAEQAVAALLASLGS